MNRRDLKNVQIFILVIALAFLAWQGYSYYQQWQLHKKDIAYLSTRAEFYATLPADINKPDINRSISDENIRYKRMIQNRATWAGLTILVSGALIGGLEFYKRRLMLAKAAAKKELSEKHKKR